MGGEYIVSRNKEPSRSNIGKPQPRAQRRRLECFGYNEQTGREKGRKTMPKSGVTDRTIWGVGGKRKRIQTEKWEKKREKEDSA